MSQSLQINKYLPVAILFFFFNSLFLPHGLLYTTLLTPVFLVWLYKYPSFNYLWLFFIVTIPYAAIHFSDGVNPAAYIKSYALLFTVYVFGLAFYQFLKSCNTLPNLYKTIVLLNFFIVLLAIVAFLIPVVKDIFWFQNTMTSGAGKVYRLKLFTYEASYYSFLLVPIALYYYLKILLLRFPNKWLVFWLVSIPLFLSLSFGIISGLVITLILLFCSDVRLLTLNPRLSGRILLSIAAVFLCLFLFIKLYPDNFIFIRIANIFGGKDTSFTGRTFDSIYLGWELAAQKNLFFGSGPGQIKIIGVETFNKFYRHTFTPDQLAIPNSIGDTLAQFGILGVLIKLFLVFYFFFKTRVYTNFYRLSLFLFIFIYQFTGSYITNIVEYAIWILAFYPPLFPEFDKKKIFAEKNEESISYNLVNQIAHQ